MTKKTKHKPTESQRLEKNLKLREKRAREKAISSEWYKTLLVKERARYSTDIDRTILRNIPKIKAMKFEEGRKKGWRQACGLMNLWIKRVNGPHHRSCKLVKKELNRLDRIDTLEVRAAQRKQREQRRN